MTEKITGWNSITACNPGNLRWYPGGGSDWIGLITKPVGTPYVAGDFCRFEMPWHGVRAMQITLRYHFRNTMAKDGTPTDTVSEIITLYAPPVENPTKGYIAFVLDLMGIPVGTVLNLEKRSTMRKLCRAMMHFETDKAKPFGPRTAGDRGEGADRGQVPA